LELLIDPIIGPAILLPDCHHDATAYSYQQTPGKINNRPLNARQKELHLMENLANIFEKNMTFWRMMLPITEPIGWNKKTKAV